MGERHLDRGMYFKHSDGDGCALPATTAASGDAWPTTAESRARNQASLDALAASGDVEAALRTALTVALHETFDPDCSGEPPYDSSQRLAAEVIGSPVVQAAIRAESGGLDVERLATAMGNLRWGWLTWTDQTQPAEDRRRRRALKNAALALAAEYARLAEDADKD